MVKVGNEPEPANTSYTVAFDLFEIQGLPKSEYYVVVSVGPHTVSSTKRKSEKTHEVYYYQYSMPVLV